jgi:hypothetical protein
VAGLIAGSLIVSWGTPCAKTRAAKPSGSRMPLRSLDGRLATIVRPSAATSAASLNSSCRSLKAAIARCAASASSVPSARHAGATMSASVVSCRSSASSARLSSAAAALTVCTTTWSALAIASLRSAFTSQAAVTTSATSSAQVADQTIALERLRPNFIEP